MKSQNKNACMVNVSISLWRDSNPQSPDLQTGALSIRPHKFSHWKQQMLGTWLSSTTLWSEFWVTWALLTHTIKYSVIILVWWWYLILLYPLLWWPPPLWSWIPWGRASIHPRSCSPSPSHTAGWRPHHLGQTGGPWTALQGSPDPRHRDLRL